MKPGDENMKRLMLEENIREAGQCELQLNVAPVKSSV